jgi:hypothetical protein
MEGELPPSEWHTEFKERLYTAIKNSTPQNIKQPEIKGVVTTATTYKTKKEYWKLFLAEKQEAKEQKIKKEEREAKEAAAREAREREERERVAKERERVAKEREKEHAISEHASLYNIKYYNKYFSLEDISQVDGSKFYKEKLLEQCKYALKNIYLGTSYDVSEKLIEAVKSKKPLAELLKSPADWGGGAYEAIYFDVKDNPDPELWSDSTLSLLTSIKPIVDKISGCIYDKMCYDTDSDNVLFGLLTHYCRLIIVKRTGETDPYQSSVQQFFLNNEEWVNTEAPLTGFIKFVKEYDFKKLNEDTNFEYTDKSLKLFIDNLDEIKNQIGVGGMNLNISEDAKDTLRQGARRGTIKAATRKAADHIAEAVAGQTSGKSKRELAAYKQHVAEFLKTEWGQAAVSAIAGQALPLIAERLGKGEAVKSLAKELNIQGVEIVTEQVAGAAFDLASMGVTHLIDTLKNVVEQDEVNVTPVASLEAGQGQRVETARKVVETVG